jgi:hypothetical protein
VKRDNEILNTILLSCAWSFRNPTIDIKDDPIILQQALDSPNSHEWKEAVKNEYHPLLENGILEVFKPSRENNCHNNPIDDKQFKNIYLLIFLMM